VPTFLLFNLQPLAAQTEWLVTVDASTGKFSKIDSIPGVMWIWGAGCTIIDEKNGQVLFPGSPTTTDFSLITLDQLTGNVLFRAPKTNKIIALQYSNSLDKLYGLVADAGAYSLATINKATAAYTVIKNIPGVDGITEFVLDDNNHRLFLKGVANGNYIFSTIDLLTGDIISQSSFYNINFLFYDHLTNKLYGLKANPGNPSYFTLVEVDPGAGSYSDLFNLTTEIQGLGQGNATYNERDHLFIFTAINNTGIASLYAVDINTGQVIYKVPAFVANDIAKDNLIQFRYDNTSQKLFALHWEAKTTRQLVDPACKFSIQTKLYPNPFSDFFVVQKTPTTCAVRLNLYNELGQIIIRERVINDGRNEIHLANLSSGLYFYKFYSGEKTILNGKIIKD
jgi:hypothetical protein